MRFGVVLHAKYGLAAVAHARYGSVVEVAMGQLHVRMPGERLCIHRKAMVLGGDFASTGGQMEDWMVYASVAVFHFIGRNAHGQGNDLVPKTNAEHGFVGGYKLSGGFNYLLEGFGVAGAIGNEKSIGFPSQYFLAVGVGGKNS